MTDSGHVEGTIDDAVLRLRLSNPEHRNALTPRMMDALVDALAGIPTSEPRVRAVLLTGDADNFCAGADIGPLAEVDGATAAREYIEEWRRLYEALERVECPTVCAVDGYALGAGLELCLAADLVVATEEALFGLPEVRLGAVPGYAMIRLTPLVGRSRALELMYSGRTMTAREAHDWGLVSRVVGASELADTADELVTSLATGPPLALAAIKRTAGRATSPAEWEAFVAGAAFVVASQDRVAGTAAFLERQRPTFHGH